MARCKRYHTIPRDLTIDEDTGLLRITPIPEIATLRQSTAVNVTGLSRVGSQIEVVLTCSGVRPGATGAFGVDVLATASGDEYTRLGVNLTTAQGEPPSAFVDTSRTAGGAAGYDNPGTNVVPLWQLHQGTAIDVTVLVDGGMIEAFFGEHLPITTLVQPSNASGAPDARYARPFSTAAGVTCATRISKLASLVGDMRL